ILRWSAAYHPDQGHWSRSGAQPAHALHHQPGQAWVHWQIRNAYGGGWSKHRHPQSRARQAGRRCYLPCRSGRADLRRNPGQGPSAADGYAGAPAGVLRNSARARAPDLVVVTVGTRRPLISALGGFRWGGLAAMRYLIGLVAVLWTWPLGAGELPARSTVDSVTVFPSGAELRRIVRLQLSAGDHTVIIDDLPQQAVASSIRVEGKATGKLQIG